MDVDGDMLNMCREKWMIDAAKRTIEKYDIVPLFYDAIRADKEMVNLSNMFHGLKRAHENSGIGQISNALTKLWNRFDRPDEESVKAAGWITYMNNRVIDAAKTGDACKYPDKVKEIIDRATGGEHGKMPYFFQYSKNGRRADGTSGDKCEDKNRSVMNDLCTLATNEDTKGDKMQDQIKMNFKNVPNFNYRMLLNHLESPVNEAARQAFLDEAAKVQSGIVASELFSQENLDEFSTTINSKFELGADKIKLAILSVCSLEDAYDTIVRDLYAASNLDKIAYKRYFWEIFGEVAEKNLKYNIDHCHVCEECGQMIPDWDIKHEHQGEDELHYICVDCGKAVDVSYDQRKKNGMTEKDVERMRRKQRCKCCQEKYEKQYDIARVQATRAAKKQAEAEQKIRELKAKILSELQYDVKIG